MSGEDDSAWYAKAMLARRMRRRDVLRLAGLTAGLVAFGCRSDDDPRPSPTPTLIPAPTPAIVETVEGYDDPAVWAGRTLTVTSWGGEYQTAQEEAIFEPFQRLTGARIDVESTDIVQLRDQVEDGDVEWDVCDVLLEDVLPLANLGLLEEIDYNVVTAEGIFDDMRMQHATGSSYYATICAFRADAWPDILAPTGWADFWDVQRFPGNRGLHRDPQTSLEFALLADGVAQDDLYPLDVERAFASLERIRASLTLWWEQGAQAAQTLTSGDLVMVSAWHSRILTIQEEGAEIGIVWEGGALSGDAWVVPKEAPNRDLAMDFINFATRPEVCAAFSTLVPFGPVHQGAFDLLPAGRQSVLPSSPELKPRLFRVDLDWWFNHRETTQERFEEWLAEHP